MPSEAVQRALEKAAQRASRLAEADAADQGPNAGQVDKNPDKGKDALLERAKEKSRTSDCCCVEKHLSLISMKYYLYRRHLFFSFYWLPSIAYMCAT